MYLCKKCKKRLNQQNRKFCSVKCSNQFNKNNKKHIHINKISSNELAELFGILIGDGSVTKYYIRIYLNIKADKGYSTNIVKLINKIFPEIKVVIKYRKERGTEELQISSKEISDYLFELGFNAKDRVIPKWIKEDINLSKRTLRGLFDTEGSMSIKKFQTLKGISIYKQLTFTNKNKDVLNFVKTILKELEFSPTKNNGNNIYISNKKDMNMYFEKIGTNNPKLEKKYKIK